jgi:hypothetical protein
LHIVILVDGAILKISLPFTPLTNEYLRRFFSSFIGGAKGGTPLATLLSRTAGCAQFVYEKVIRFNCDDTLIDYTLCFEMQMHSLPMPGSEVISTLITAATEVAYLQAYLIYLEKALCKSPSAVRAYSMVIIVGYN